MNYVGAAALISITFDPRGDVHTVPSEVTLTIVKPDGTQIVVTSSTFTIVGVDQYEYEYTPDAPGTYTAVWKSAGTVDHVDQRTFFVSSPAA